MKTKSIPVLISDKLIAENKRAERDFCTIVASRAYTRSVNAKWEKQDADVQGKFVDIVEKMRNPFDMSQYKRGSFQDEAQNILIFMWNYNIWSKTPKMHEILNAMADKNYKL